MEKLSVGFQDNADRRPFATIQILYQNLHQKMIVQYTHQILQPQYIFGINYFKLTWPKLNTTNNISSFFFNVFLSNSFATNIFRRNENSINFPVGIDLYFVMIKQQQFSFTKYCRCNCISC